MYCKIVQRQRYCNTFMTYNNPINNTLLYIRFVVLFYAVQGKNLDYIIHCWKPTRTKVKNNKRPSEKMYEIFNSQVSLEHAHIEKSDTTKRQKLFQYFYLIKYSLHQNCSSFNLNYLSEISAPVSLGQTNMRLLGLGFRCNVIFFQHVVL